MATEFKLPSLGENIEAGDVVSVLVSEGDEISQHQPVLELETDKAVIEVPSSLSGIVKEIHVKEGDRAEVGQLVLTLQDAEAEETVEEEAEEAKKAEEKKAKEKEEVDEEEQEEETEEVAREGAPERADAAHRGEIIDFARPRAEEAPAKRAPAAPSVRRFAREIGVNINQVRGSGPEGRISIEDVKAHSRESRGARTAVSAPGVSLPDFEQWGEVQRKPFSSVRRKTAQHLSLSWSSIPHVTQYDKADITDLEKARKRFGEKVAKAGGKLTVTAILVKISAAALKIFPQFNASVDMSNEEVVYKQYCHIGVAVDTDRGLLVPVIRDVDQKNITELSAELSEVAEKARNAKLSLEEMQGGSFTISNLGGLGGTYFSPIVNSPEVAILGVSRGAVEPIYNNGEFEPRLMLPLSLSYDHRLIDGADAIRFLRWIVQALEDPFLIALEA